MRTTNYRRSDRSASKNPDHDRLSLQCKERFARIGRALRALRSQGEALAQTMVGHKYWNRWSKLEWLIWLVEAAEAALPHFPSRALSYLGDAHLVALDLSECAKDPGLPRGYFEDELPCPECGECSE